MSFKVGQKVVFLHEKGSGVIKAINTLGKYVIDDIDGFEKTYFHAEIALVYTEEYNLGNEDVSIIKEESFQVNTSGNVNKQILTGRRRPMDVWEIDLHSHEIIESERGLTNTEILRMQLSAFRVFFERARNQSVRKVIVIHGVGEGVLKFEVRRILDKVSGVNYYDADFREYGKGATAVEISYNY